MTSELPPVDQAALREAMSLYPTGVTIVTSGCDNDLCGMVANSFTSVSLSPPIVLVCMQRGARTCEAAKRSGWFAIHITHRDQLRTVRDFIGREAPRFDATPYELDEHGTPLLCDWLALLVARVHGALVVGDHEIVLGEVARCETRPGGPLLFHRSAMRVLPELPPLPLRGEPPLSEDIEDLAEALVRVVPMSGNRHG